MKGLLGNSENFQGCSTKVGAMMSEAGELVGHLRSHDFGAVLDDLSVILSMLADSLQKGACWRALHDLKPLSKILKDGPLGIGSNLAQNFLEADAEILELMKLHKHCSFLHPDGGKCGYMIGAITRDILVGLEFKGEVVV